MSWKTTVALLCGMAIGVAACQTTPVKPVGTTSVRATVAQAPSVTAGEDVITRNFLQLPDPKAGLQVKSEHYIRDWLVLGPFIFETGKHGGDEDQGAAKIEFVKDEANLAPKEGVEVNGKKWARYKNTASDAEPEYIDLNQFYKDIDYCAAYLGCSVYAPKDLDNLTFMTGSDDYETVWINGKKLYTYEERRRSPAPDQDSIKGVSLKKGKNVIIVKVVDVVDRWGFYGRFTDEKGNPMKITDKP
jgi:hypothetical protein